ncbi:glycosyltransferase family 2 protein [Sporomusa acidovorans]|uniref:Undecaprenyl-phosphate 4-deoxy-4-formamido-L-arabinose transferase n=1 Tax=Sporomusa acidovorans (strain ATCC 49682 / DSM 3132 / Mol) TaxID=1123286 RepID=A0ABZ3J9I5_SPOA4|nr:glycosyltransferase family 2 protein [Sporomusa acidovorans]OZC22908.1 putative glycosyltransferase EpsE [Sporomusa acidovorans DSM 3132]SDE95518.1 Glycosyl transferase family 2 [Sporomusa acidovorans]
MTVTNPTPKVTVITAVYNSVPYLAACLDSLLKQTFTDFEVLIVDDGSVDGSDRIYNQYASHDNRIRVLHFNNNHGIGYCRAASLRKAHGEYIAVLDADNIAAPHRLERQVAWLNEHQSTVLLASYFGIINHYGNLIGAEELALNQLELRWRLIFGNCLEHSTVMFRKQAALACGGYDPAIRLGEDMDFYSRLICHGSAEMIPEKLSLWRSRHQCLAQLDSLNHNNTNYAQLVSHAIRRHLGLEVSLEVASALFNHGYLPAQNLSVFTDAVKLTLLALELFRESPYFAPEYSNDLGRCTFTQLMELQQRNKNQPWWPQAFDLWERALQYLTHTKYNWLEDRELVWQEQWLSQKDLAAAL